MAPVKTFYMTNKLTETVSERWNRRTHHFPSDVNGRAIHVLLELGWVREVTVFRGLCHIFRLLEV